MTKQRGTMCRYFARNFMSRDSLRASRVRMSARTEPRPPKRTFPDSQDHARSFSGLGACL